MAPVDFIGYAAVVLGYAIDSLKCPNAEQVELLSWKSIKDIAGDGGVIKTIETEGKGWEKPRDKDEALGGSSCFTTENLQAAAVYNRPAAGPTFHSCFSPEAAIWAPLMQMPLALASG